MIEVIKLSGEKAPYSEQSLKQSLINSGADQEVASQIVANITKELYNGITTKELYHKAFDQLKNVKSSVAARYSLKRALQKLGPEGFYFEKWVAKIFETRGCATQTSQTLEGKSTVTHEIDVLAADKNYFYLCECKFRNDMEAKISVTTPMYFLSRFTDLVGKEFNYFNKPFIPNKGCLITNAFFTSDSINFAKYYDIELISWNYPEDRSIKNITDSFALYPITCLTSLTDEEEQKLLEKNCILVKELVNNPVLLDHFKFDTNRKNTILEEANDLLNKK